MSTDTRVIWFNGEFVPWDDANVHVLTHTLHYSLGCFEGIRAYETATGPAIFRLQAHVDRLFRSAHILGMTLPYSPETLCTAQKNLIKNNQLKSAYIRPLCFYGVGQGIHASNLKVEVMIAAWEWGDYHGKESAEKGIRAQTSHLTRNTPNSALCKAKAVGNYLNSALAVRDAKCSGYDEALLLDSQGYVAEGSGENIFIVRNGALYTPDTGSILEGITRETVMTFAHDQGISMTEKRLTRDDLYTADEVFLTGTAVEIVPVREVDGRTIGKGVRGPMTTRLQALYADTVRGKNAQYLDWVEPC